MMLTRRHGVCRRSTLAPRYHTTGRLQIVCHLTQQTLVLPTCKRAGGTVVAILRLKYDCDDLLIVGDRQVVQTEVMQRAPPGSRASRVGAQRTPW